MKPRARAAFLSLYIFIEVRSKFQDILRLIPNYPDFSYFISIIKPGHRLMARRNRQNQKDKPKNQRFSRRYPQIRPDFSRRARSENAAMLHNHLNSKIPERSGSMSRRDRGSTPSREPGENWLWPCGEQNMGAANRGRHWPALAWSCISPGAIPPVPTAKAPSSAKWVPSAMCRYRHRSMIQHE